MVALTQKRLAPGPPGHFLLGSTPDFWRDSLRTFMTAWREYGDVVQFRFGGPFRGFLLAHPDHVKHVLQDNHRNYRKVPWYNGKLKALVGEGLVTSEGDLWLRQRRLMQPAFHRQRIAALGTMMVEETVAMLEGWNAVHETGQPLDVAQEMMRLTLTIVAKAMFGADVSREAAVVGQAVTIGIDYVNRRMQSYFNLPESLPLPSIRRFVRARETLDAIVYRMIEERRRSGEERDDLLGMLLRAHDVETDAAMSDRQLHDEVMTIFLAGHETTAVALSWTWYLLSTHPEVRRRLREALDGVLGGRPPTVDDLPRLGYVEMVIQEAMRLYPPAWALSRMAIGEDELPPEPGGYHIPGGKPVYLLPYVTHRHPSFWENPEGFDPERFAPERSASRPRYAYFPFGGGPRQCIGNHFAMMEAQLILATIAQRYRLDLLPGHPIALDPKITLRPKFGIKVRLERAK